MPRLPEFAPAPRVVVVGAGRDGAGCTVTATLLALAAYATDHRVVVADQALRAHTLLQLLGLSASTGGPEAIAVDERFTLVTAGAWPEGLPGAARLACEAASDADILVVVAGARLATLVSAAAMAAGVRADPDLVVLAHHDRIGLAASYAALKTMAERLPDARLHATTSRMEHVSATIALAEFGAAVEHCLGRPCAPLPGFPDDATLAAALDARMPLAEALSGSPVLDAAARCWSALAGSIAPALVA